MIKKIKAYFKKKKQPQQQIIHIHCEEGTLLIAQKEHLCMTEAKEMQKILSKNPKFIICDTDWKFIIFKERD